MTTSSTIPGDGGRVLTIDCDQCALQGSSACGDCVVTFLVARDRGRSFAVADAEVRALGALARVGLAPVLRHRQRRPA